MIFISNLLYRVSSSLTTDVGKGPEKPIKDAGEDKINPSEPFIMSAGSAFPTLQPGEIVLLIFTQSPDGKVELVIGVTNHAYRRESH